MAGFDPTLDKELFCKDITFEGTTVKVAVKQYNEGIKKLQIGRENMNAEGEPRFAKLGRLTKEEAELLVPAVTEALTHMD